MDNDVELKKWCVEQLGTDFGRHVLYQGNDWVASADKLYAYVKPQEEHKVDYECEYVKMYTRYDDAMRTNNFLKQVMMGMTLVILALIVVITYIL